MTDARKLGHPEPLGFRDGATSVHTSRTMMFAELSLVLDHVEMSAPPREYVATIVDQNLLGKPTQTTRKRSAERLIELYSLDPSCAIFRLLRHFWPSDPASRPMLAFLAVAARDRLLREATPFVLAIPLHATVESTQVANHLRDQHPSRFKPTTLLSTAQNVASSWTQAGYLTGKFKKIRTPAVVTPVVVTYSLVLGYLCGARGRMLLDTTWTRILDRTPADIADLAVEASRQGWLNYKAVGSVVEVTFPGLLTADEERLSHDTN